MTARWRILIQVVAPPERPARLASARVSDGAPWEVAVLGAQLLKLGAEVRVMDQHAEGLSARTLRREARWWKPSLTILHVGGSDGRADPVPDDRPLAELLTRWNTRGQTLLAGPLSRLYGAELLSKSPKLSGRIDGRTDVTLRDWCEGGGLASGLNVPGLIAREGAQVPNPPLPGGPEIDGSRLLPAWHLLPLEAYPAGGRRELMVRVSGQDPEADLAEIRHAVFRGQGRFLRFETLGDELDPRGLERVAQRMFAAAPGLAWSCRLSAEMVDPSLALALFRGACREVVLSATLPHSEPGRAPMDDPRRTRIEAAVDTLRATGLMTEVEFVLGRPGHDKASLLAWQRWFADRQVVVRPHVRIPHPELGSAGAPISMAEALNSAGTRDNALRVRDLERLVRMFGGFGAARRTG